MADTLEWESSAEQSKREGSSPSRCTRLWRNWKTQCTQDAFRETLLRVRLPSAEYGHMPQLEDGTSSNLVNIEGSNPSVLTLKNNKNL